MVTEVLAVFDPGVDRIRCLKCGHRLRLALLHQQGERGVKQIGAERPVVTCLAGQVRSALDGGNPARGVGEDLHGADHIECSRRRGEIAELLGEGERLLGERDCKLPPAP